MVQLEGLKLENSTFRPPRSPALAAPENTVFTVPPVGGNAGPARVDVVVLEVVLVLVLLVELVDEELVLDVEVLVLEVDELLLLVDVEVVELVVLLEVLDVEVDVLVVLLDVDVLVLVLVEVLSEVDVDELVLVEVLSEVDVDELVLVEVLSDVEVDELVLVDVDEDVVVGGTVDVVVVAGQAAATACLQTSLYPVPPAMSLCAQFWNAVQSRLVSAPFTTVYTARTSPLGGCEMSIGESPRLFPTSLTSLVGLITETLVAPPVGAVLFTYLATVSLLTSQLAPCGARNAPEALSYEMSSCALIWLASVPLPFTTEASLATNTALALDAATILSTMTSLLPTIEMSAARAVPAPTINPTATANAIVALPKRAPLECHYPTRMLQVKGN